MSLLAWVQQGVHWMQTVADSHLMERSRDLRCEHSETDECDPCYLSRLADSSW